MALIEVRVPQLSESVAEATLLQWHRKTGEAVARDENLIDIETDKVVLELPAPSAGVLTQILKPDGSTVAAGEVIAMIDSEARAGAATRRAAAGRCRAGASRSRRCCSRCRCRGRRRQGRGGAAGRRQADGRGRADPGAGERHRP